jgi:hypothetical protein
VRKGIFLAIKDKAQEHAYVAKSTIPGAGYGLFALRRFDDQTDGPEHVGEYKGGTTLTEDRVYAPGRNRDYAIIHGGLLRDAWDHIRKRVQSLVPYTNDPLDAALENSMWWVENQKLYMDHKPGSIIEVDGEFLIAYGNEHWCNENLDFELLQRAVWRYRKDIDLSPNGCWPRHSKAHALFNTAYNGQLPFAFTTCPCSVCVGAVTQMQIEPKSTTKRQREPLTKSANSTKQTSTDKTIKLPNSHISDTLTSRHASEKHPLPHLHHMNSRQGDASPMPTEATKTQLYTKHHPQHNILSTQSSQPAKHTPHQHLEQRSFPHPPSKHPHAIPLNIPSLTQLAATHDINLEPHIKQQLQPKPGRINNNTYFGVKVQRQRTSVPKDAGNGLFASVDIEAFTIIGIYTGGEALTKEQVSRTTYKSDYVVNVHGIIRDGYNRKTKSLHSDTACINDNLDPSNANCDWYVHPDFPTLLLVVANRRIADDEQLYLSYGPDYWCQDRFPIHILKAAVKGYAIDIDKSATWRRLKCYKELRRALDTNDNENIKAPSKSKQVETDDEASPAQGSEGNRSQSTADHASSDLECSESTPAMHFEPGWHDKNTTKRSKNKTANDTVTRRPTENKTQTTVNKNQTTDNRQSTVTVHPGLKRQRKQEADLNTRPKKRTKTESTDPEIPMTKTLHNFFSTDPGAPTSKKRGTHPTESAQRRKGRKVQPTDDGACEDPHVDSNVDSRNLFCMEAHTVHSLRPTHNTRPTDRQCDLPAHDKRIADS